MRRRHARSESHGDSATRRGFTIIELMVAIAIVSVLVGLTLGAVSYSREVARRSACSAKLWSNGAAINAYVVDNKRFPDLCYTASGSGSSLVISIPTPPATNPTNIASIGPSGFKTLITEKPKPFSRPGLSAYSVDNLLCPNEVSPSTVPVLMKKGNITAANPLYNVVSSFGYNLELVAISRNVAGFTGGIRNASGMVLMYDGAMTDPSGGVGNVYTGPGSFTPSSYQYRHIKQMNVLYADGSVSAGQPINNTSFYITTPSTGTASSGTTTGSTTIASTTTSTTGSTTGATNTSGNNGNSNGNGNANSNIGNNGNANLASTTGSTTTGSTTTGNNGNGNGNGGNGNLNGNNGNSNGNGNANANIGNNGNANLASTTGSTTTGSTTASTTGSTTGTTTTGSTTGSTTGNNGNGTGNGSNKK